MPANDVDKWWNLAGQFLKGYAVLWMTAVGGIVGANILGLIGLSFFSPDLKSESMVGWVHWGWYIGTGLFLFGALTGRMRMLNQHKWSTLDKAVTDQENIASAKQESPVCETDQVECDAKQGWQSWFLGGALAGGIIGFLFGASLLVFFFSWAYSPFATRDAVQAVDVVTQSLPNSTRQHSFLAAKGWLPVLLCLVPSAIGSTAGALLLSVLYVREKRRS